MTKTNEDAEAFALAELLAGPLLRTGNGDYRGVRRPRRIPLAVVQSLRARGVVLPCCIRRPRTFARGVKLSQPGRALARIVTTNPQERT